MKQASRREVLAAGVAGAALLACSRSAAAGPRVASRKGEADVTPAEDLMREHGLLRRILLVYEAGLARLGDRKAPHEVLGHAARIVRRFVENYHERLEEQHLFPRFIKAGIDVELVGVLRSQHDAGRVLTDRLLAAADGKLADQPSRDRARDSIAAFIRMYRPHAAREDTVLFADLHRVVSGKDYDELGDRFEDEEHRLFGPRGFEGVRDEVADLERAMGIADLASFTPAVSGP